MHLQYTSMALIYINVKECGETSQKPKSIFGEEFFLFAPKLRVSRATDKAEHRQTYQETREEERGVRAHEQRGFQTQ